MTRLRETWFPMDDSPPHVEVKRAAITHGDRILARMLGMSVGQLIAEHKADDVPAWEAKDWCESCYGSWVWGDDARCAVHEIRQGDDRR